MADNETPTNLPTVPSGGWKEHAQNLVLAGVAGIPHFGGPISSLLSSYLPDWKLRRIGAILDQLSGDFENLRQEVDEEKLKTAEYGLRVEHVIRQVSQTPSDVKVEAYRAVLVNGVTKTAPPESEQAFFLSRLDRLDELHVAIIGMTRAVGQQNAELVDRLRSHLAQHDLDLIQSAYNDLVQMGMALDSANAAGHLTNEADVRYVHNLLTPLGKRFAEFVTLE